MRIYQQPIEVHLGLISTGQPVSTGRPLDPESAPTADSPGSPSGASGPDSRSLESRTEAAGLESQTEETTRIEGPARFTWRRRMWVVRTVQTRWVQTAPWWDSPAAQAVRSAGIDPDPDADVLGEQEIWRVLASDGRESGVFELLHDPATHTWQLSKVVD